MNINNITKDWTHADAFLNKRIEDVSTEVNDSKTNILSTVVASSNATASNSKTLEFQGTGKNLEKLAIEGKTSQDGTPSPSAPKDVKGVGDGGWNIMPFAKKETKSQNGVTIASDGYGTYTLSGTASASTEIFFDIPEFVVPKSIGSGGKSKLYFFNTKAYSGSATVSIRFYNASTRIDGYTLATTNRTDSSNTALNEQIVNRISFPVSSGCVTNLTVSPMVTNDGNTTHDFSAGGKYKIPISCGGKSSNIYLDEPLFDGEILDTESGSVDKIKKLFTLTGDEAWTLQSTNSYGIANFKTTLPVNATSNGGAICSNHFVRQTSVIADTKTPGVTISNNTDLYIRLQSSVVATVDAMKAWLKANPTYVIYGINATKETFDGAEIPTAVGKNTLTVGTDVTPAKVEVTSFGEYYSKAQIDKMFADVQADLAAMAELL